MKNTSTLDQNRWKPPARTAGTQRTRHSLILGLGLLVPYLNADAAQAPVNLRTAGDFAILAKSGISTVPASKITGDIGVSPIDSTAITGFSLILDSTTQFSTSPQVTGKVYAASYASPTPTKLTSAVSDMQTAYTDAAGRTLPDFTELGTGNIGGMTLAPGLYKWGTGVTIPENVTLAGSATDIWIFQIAGSLSMAGAKSVILSGGAQADHIFWQVAGGVGADLGTTSHFEGIILAAKGINLQTGASINGRLLAQTAVTLDSATVKIPVLAAIVLVSSPNVAGPYASAPGQSVNTATKTVTAPVSGAREFYGLKAGTALRIKSVSLSAGNVVITYL